MSSGVQLVSREGHCVLQRDSTGPKKSTATVEWDMVRNLVRLQISNPNAMIARDELWSSNAEDMF